jgi:hypothetical protein
MASTTGRAQRRRGGSGTALCSTAWLRDRRAARLDALIRNGRRAAAVELFMMEAAEATAEALAAMRRQPSWPQADAVAHTLACDAAVTGATAP